MKGSDSSDPLDAAAGRAVENLTGSLTLPDDASLRRQVDDLAASLRSVLRGAAAPYLPFGIHDSLDLLRALRTEVVTTWPEEDPFLPMMRAFEAVQERILTSRDEEAGRPGVDRSARLVLRELAHMMRSPLGSIVMLAETLADPNANLPPERAHRALMTIYNAAMGLLANAADLLTMLDDDLEGPGPATEFSLEEVLEVVADIVRPVAQVRGCDIVLRVPDEDSRTGPGPRIKRTMLELGLRMARRTRDGIITLGATGNGSGTLVFFVDAEGAGAAPDEGGAEILEIFQPDDRDGQGFTLSAEALSVSAAARLIRSMGSELRTEQSSDNRLRLSFSVSLL